MNPSNFRVVKTEQGYAVFRVYYDSRGNAIRCEDTPVVDFFSDSACGLLDQIESIELAFEKNPLDLADIGK